MMELNWTRAPFDNPMVQESRVPRGRPRQGPTTSYFPGVSWPGSPFPPTSWFGRTEEEIATWPGFRYGPDGEKDAEDIAMAKQLMADAGYADGFEVDLVSTINNKAQWDIIGPDLERYLGIKVNGQFLDFATAIAAEAELRLRYMPRRPRVELGGPGRDHSGDIPPWRSQELPRI